MTVQLRPVKPTICEILVWVWAATLYLEELRQVSKQSILLTSYNSNIRKICKSVVIKQNNYITFPANATRYK